MPLTCEDCGRESDENAYRWRAILGVEEDDSDCVVIFCPWCAEQFDSESSRRESRRRPTGNEQVRLWRLTRRGHEALGSGTRPHRHDHREGVGALG